ncbi:MAG: TatD DNase family protein [Shewanella sp.]|jgi:TatD DNase family protein
MSELIQVKPLVNIIDSHAHLDFADFDTDRNALFQSMKRVGIQTAIIPGVSPAHWDKQLHIAAQYSCPYALGIHPWFCDKDFSNALCELDKLISETGQNSRFIAIGECGLDKLHKGDWEVQLKVFEHQLMLAKSLNLPVILHVVRAHNEMITLLQHYKLARGGVVHGFYGSQELANEYVKLGYKLGIGGLILNSDAKKLKDCITQISLNSIIVETDSPAMSPKNAPVKRNTPHILPLIIDEIAKLKNKSSVLVRERVFDNVTQLFDL